MFCSKMFACVNVVASFDRKTKCSDLQLNASPEKSELKEFLEKDCLTETKSLTSHWFKPPSGNMNVKCTYRRHDVSLHRLNTAVLQP